MIVFRPLIIKRKACGGNILKKISQGPGLVPYLKDLRSKMSSKSPISMDWEKMPCLSTELNLSITLCAGQSFRWRQTNDGNWTGVIGNKVWILKQDESYLYYKVISKNAIHAKKRKKTDIAEAQTEEVKTDDEGKLKEKEINERILSDYFRLDQLLSSLYSDWCKKDLYFSKIASSLQGVRMLRQDPTETLFAFICSSNNNIARISQMVFKLCENYGKELVSVEGMKNFTFPSIESLCTDDVEQTLRTLGFGYRAKFISQTAKKLYSEHGDKCDSWLMSLRKQPYEYVKSELIKFQGVGRKVADCVALMSMDKLDSIPVDTHIFQIAAKHYMPGLKLKKSVTDSIYDDIGKVFREVWGPYAGWAQAVVFCSELKHLQGLTGKSENEKKKGKPFTATSKRSEPVGIAGKADKKTRRKRKLTT